MGLMPADIYFDKGIPDWRREAFNDDLDDDELERTPEDVVQILGFDPAEESTTDARSPITIYNQDPHSTRRGELWCGFDVRIENPAGSFRSGVDSQGHMWQTQLQNPYGFVNGVRGKDKDHLDVFLGPDPMSHDIFVIDQVDPYTHRFDEHKVVLGAHDIDEAKSIYLSNYQDGWQGMGAISKTSPDDFKEWVRQGGPQSGPYVGYSG